MFKPSNLVRSKPKIVKYADGLEEEKVYFGLFTFNTQRIDSSKKWKRFILSASINMMEVQQTQIVFNNI